MYRIFHSERGSVASEISYGVMCVGILVLGGLWSAKNAHPKQRSPKQQHGRRKRDGCRSPLKESIRSGPEGKRGAGDRRRGEDA